MAPTINSSVVIAAKAQGGAAQPLDLVSLADVKLELGITETANDPWLAKAITRASRAISQACTRVFQTQGYQEQFWATPEAYPWQLPSGFFPLQLNAWPLASTPSPALTAPPVMPTLGIAAGGVLSAAIYYVRVSYLTPSGETAGSMEASLIVAANSLLTVQAPIPDNQGIATGWNVYIGTKSFGETLQNASPIPMGENWTLPTSGLVTTTSPPPPYILAVENFQLAPCPLAEGVDFVSDYNPSSPDFSKGWLTRLFPIDGSPRKWIGLPNYVLYQAGYPAIPDDLQDGAIQLVKAKWFSKTRDPLLRSENVVGVYEAAWFFDTGPGSEGQFPPSVQAIIDRYRAPVIA